MNLSVRQLRAFVAAARLRSFTRAAEQLHVTQPGLSAMLRELEAQLDCRLFERTTRSVTLTVQGEAFVPTALRVLKELEDAAASLGQITATQKRKLSVGATPVIASSILPEACALFARQHPQVDVEVQDLARESIYERVQSGVLDAGFGAFLDTSRTVRRRRIFASALTLIEPAGVGPARRRWKDVPRSRMLGLPADNPIQQRVEAQLRATGEPGSFGQSFNHLHTLLAMVEAGAGLAVLPDFVASAASRYRVTLSELRTPAATVDFYEITKAGRAQNALLVSLTACLAQCAPNPR
ncbi:MAG: LysR family transcriptional regulator [Pseudomonadota bacterium]|nr:LysR family transcriptional regulator [Pseudomonadota bacterium]MDQ8002977.1 LysR family transcriptional regulator [Pseudomonadota bacterium]MDQ8019741.1 LysR family transcriptional regulator [Pseudomonadota bacterium]